MTSKKFLILVKKIFPGSTVLPPEIKNFKSESEKITVSQAGRILAKSKVLKRNKTVDKNQLSLFK